MSKALTQSFLGSFLGSIAGIAMLLTASLYLFGERLELFVKSTEKPQPSINPATVERSRPIESNYFYVDVEIPGNEADFCRKNTISLDDWNNCVASTNVQVRSDKPFFLIKGEFERMLESGCLNNEFVASENKTMTINLRGNVRVNASNFNEVKCDVYNRYIQHNRGFNQTMSKQSS